MIINDYSVFKCVYQYIVVYEGVVSSPLIN